MGDTATSFPLFASSPFFEGMMPSTNQSWSYLRDRDVVRRWLLGSPDGKVAADLLRKNAPTGNAAPILDDDAWTSWADVYEEHKDGVLLSQSCAEARGAWETRKSVKGKWRNFFSAPQGYVFRKMADTADPDFWNKPSNLYREALAHPEWCKVPRWYIVGELEKLLPKGKKIALAR